MKKLIGYLAIAGLLGFLILTAKLRGGAIDLGEVYPMSEAFAAECEPVVTVPYSVNFDAGWTGTDVGGYTIHQTSVAFVRRGYVYGVCFSAAAVIDAGNLQVSVLPYESLPATGTALTAMTMRQSTITASGMQCYQAANPVPFVSAAGAVSVRFEAFGQSITLTNVQVSGCQQ